MTKQEFDKLNPGKTILKTTINGVEFYSYVDEWFDIDEFYNHYIKIENSEIFEKLLNIIDKYNDDVQQLFDDTYLKLKNEIAPYDN